MSNQSAISAPTPPALKCCPFCGTVPTPADRDEFGIIIGCRSGCCKMYVVSGPYENLEEAAEVWNARFPTDGAVGGQEGIPTSRLLGSKTAQHENGNYMPDAP